MHRGETAQLASQTADFHTQTRAMRFVRELRTECCRQKILSRHISGPRLAERAREREENGARRERHRCAPIAHDVPAPIDDERSGFLKRLHIFQEEEAFAAS